MCRYAKRWIPRLVVAVYLGSALADESAPPPATTEKIIIDTDIGGDIDDAFAVALALQSRELQILGLSTVSGDTTARSKILDEILGVSHRQEIPVVSGSVRPLVSMPINSSSSPLYIGRQSCFGEHCGFQRS
jgi:hypothetical protein